MAIDIYCERVDASFWSEPVNALTNLSFIIAGFYGLYLARKTGRLEFHIIWLIFLAFSIGIGSFLFHTLAERWAMLADVIPIMVFVVSFILLACRKFLSLTWLKTLLYVFAFGVIYYGLSQLIALLFPNGLNLNGSEGYAPAIFALLIFSIILKLKHHPAANAILCVMIIFLISLTFRTVDMQSCSAFPLGTHFMWHVLNGLVIALLLRSMILFGR